MTPTVSGYPLERTWPAGRPIDLAATLGPLRRGAGDPSHIVADGVHWRAFHTPQGPATMALRSAGGTAHASAWGQGARWALDGLPVLLGADDDWSQLDLTGQPRLADVLRSRPGMRFTRTNTIFDLLMPTILEQKVTGTQARSAWRALVLRHGEPAPGPLEALRLPPTPAALIAVPTWDWHRFGVDISRQRTLRAAAAVAHRLEECCMLSNDEALRRLQVVPGIGLWTAAEVTQRALGHPDAVSVGDFHIHDLVVFALSGVARGDDARMLELLEPWRGQRQRIVRLIECSGVRKPKFGPRYAPQDMRAF